MCQVETRYLVFDVAQEGTTQIFKFPVLSLSYCKLSVPIHVICDYYIHKTDLADLSSLKKYWIFQRQILKCLLSLESGNLQLEQTKFNVQCSRKFNVLAKFPNSLRFPDRELSLPFSLFSLCSGYLALPGL